MRRRGYSLTRYADDWAVTCRSAQEARAALRTATHILKALGVEINPQKTRIVHIRQGFELLGYKIKRGRRLYLPPSKIKSGAKAGEMYAYPREKSIRRLKEKVRQVTRRNAPLTTGMMIKKLNPILNGWGQYYKQAHVRKLFNQLDRWVVRRIWSHHYRRWRNTGWKTLPVRKLYGEYGLVNLIRLIPSIASRKKEPL